LDIFLQKKYIAFCFFGEGVGVVSFSGSEFFGEFICFPLEHENFHNAGAFG